MMTTGVLNSWANSRRLSGLLSGVSARIDQTPRRETIDPADVPDVADFIARLTIEEPQGQQSTLVPFDLWPEQRRALEVIQTAPRLIILKARQLGITWLILAEDLWDCLHHPGVVVLYFSKGQLEADELIRRVAGMYERYDGTKSRLVKQNGSELVWDNGSRMRSLPATPSAGRSFTATKVRFDEFAFMQWGQQVYTAAKPTIDGGGKLIVFSTANGEGDAFHTLWEGAIKGLNSFATLFLPWHARPSRDAAWYARVESDALTSAEMRREYPGTPEDAFSPITADQFLEDMTLWDACLETLPPLGPREPLVLAADAGVSNDHFALVGTSRHPERRTDVAVRYARKWVPPPGGRLSYAPIKEELRRLRATYNLIVITYDPYQLHDLMTTLQEEGIVWTDPFNQNGDRTVADTQLRSLIINRRLSHDGDEGLRESIKNADREIVELKGNERGLRLVKRSADKKIDLAVALSMAAAKCLDLNI